MTRIVFIDETLILTIYSFARAIKRSCVWVCVGADAIASDRSRQTKRPVSTKILDKFFKSFHYIIYSKTCIYICFKTFSDKLSLTGFVLCKAVYSMNCFEMNICREY